MTTMTSKQRVLVACEFRRPDRVPRYDSFWEYTDPWRARFGPSEGLTDLEIIVPDEGTFPTRKGVIRQDGEFTYSVNSWGQTIRTRNDAYFYEVIDSPMKPGTDIDAVQFDPPDLDERFFLRKESLQAGMEHVRAMQSKLCVFGKTGGPYLRSTFIRGEADFLMDIAGDAPLAKAIADKMADHLIGVAAAQVRRWGLQDTGVWIFDDMAYNHGPMFSPESFEKVFLDAYRRMIKAYKAAGAKYVFLHSDGNIMPLLDMLVDAGIDGLNPLERRAGMDITAIRKRYPRLILVGGMDNCETLVQGPPDRIRREAMEIIDLAREGGVVIGAHSIGPDISMDNFDVYHQTCLNCGMFGVQQ